MKKADLHIHSTVSDGSNTIGEIIAMAKARHMDAIAITDHDTVSHHSQIPAVRGLKVTWGTELSAYDYQRKRKVHILGYGISDPRMIAEFARPVLEARHQNSLRQIEILGRQGFYIPVDDIKKADGTYIYKQHIMDYLVTRGLTEKMFGELYYRVFKNGGECDFDIVYPDAREAVQMVKTAGGIPVLAHCGQQQNFDLIAELVENGLAGLELNHPSHSEADRKLLYRYAKEYDLILTGGSDYHGIFEPGNVELGEYLSEESGINRIFG